jgi:hypothetical protein
MELFSSLILSVFGVARWIANTPPRTSRLCMKYAMSQRLTDEDGKMAMVDPSLQ